MRSGCPHGDARRIGNAFTNVFAILASSTERCGIGARSHGRRICARLHGARGIAAADRMENAGEPLEVEVVANNHKVIAQHQETGRVSAQGGEILTSSRVLEDLDCKAALVGEGGIDRTRQCKHPVRSIYALGLDHRCCQQGVAGVQAVSRSLAKHQPIEQCFSVEPRPACGGGSGLEFRDALVVAAADACRSTPGGQKHRVAFPERLQESSGELDERAV